MHVECPDGLYGDKIAEFFFHDGVDVTVDPEARFELVSAAVVGSKQVRNGPRPKPEVEVAVRDVLRAQKAVTFLVPWGGRKQVDGAGVDVLDLCAIRQLARVKEVARRGGWDFAYVLRVDDLIDRVLFGDESVPQIEAYTAALRTLAVGVGEAVAESDRTTWAEFSATVAEYYPVFHGYLVGGRSQADLAAIGWAGTIPEAQQRYYYDAYRTYYPGQNPQAILARYLAGSLARVKLGTSPPGAHAQVAFNNPVPGAPAGKVPRLYYRSVPERHTHRHRAPWLARGYLEITEAAGETSVTPKILMYGEPPPGGLTPNTLVVDGVEVAAPYVTR